MSLKIHNRRDTKVFIRVPSDVSGDLGVPTGDFSTIETWAYVIYTPGTERTEDGLQAASRTRAAVIVPYDSRIKTDARVAGPANQTWRVRGVARQGRDWENLLRLDCESESDA